MFNSLAVDGSDGVCLPRRLGAVQCPVHLGDGRPAKGEHNDDGDDDDAVADFPAVFVQLCHGAQQAVRTPYMEVYNV